MSKVSWFFMLILHTSNQTSGHYIMYIYSEEKTEMSSTRGCRQALCGKPAVTELWPRSLRRKKDSIPLFEFHINEEVSSCQKTVNAASCVLKDHDLSALSEVPCYLIRVEPSLVGLWNTLMFKQPWRKDSQNIGPPILKINLHPKTWQQFAAVVVHT